MIIRIVHMQFNPSEEESFIEIYERTRPAILAFPGCSHVELFKATNHSNSYTTISHWENADQLELYRSSTLFRSVWPQVKKLLIKPAEAYSLVVVN